MKAKVVQGELRRVLVFSCLMLFPFAVCATTTAYSISSDFSKKLMLSAGPKVVAESRLNITVPSGRMAKLKVTFQDETLAPYTTSYIRATVADGSYYDVPKSTASSLSLSFQASTTVHLGLIVTSRKSGYQPASVVYVLVEVSFVSFSPGTVSVSSARTVSAGNTLYLTLTRSGGSTGAIAVKYKSQTSTGICGQDFAYVKDILTWGDGDTSSRTIAVPTYVNASTPYPKMLRVKLSTLTTGDYTGYVAPRLSESKIYATMEAKFNPGTIKVTKAVSMGSIMATSISEPWVVHPGDTLRLRLSRVGGSDGSIAVKYKTQTSTGICGEDFDYVKEILTWSHGDASDRMIDVQTYNKSWKSYPLLLRVKLSTLATGVYSGNLVPTLAPQKIYVEMR